MVEQGIGRPGNRLQVGGGLRTNSGGQSVPGSGPTIALRWAHRMLPRGLVSDRPWDFHARPLVRRAGSPVRQVVCWKSFGREHPV
ncbi:hypothetical protein AVEN_194335-1 [Araneus ventricosus]|uniref:Uncharacterized protein n=1 Tax=Araneus ventricosus TaxID=182803 RepID=A0A4Y2DYU8_ARAVE|nr:hypothetical protein AVEN_194335-1 [Araneus ventricosus]